MKTSIYVYSVFKNIKYYNNSIWWGKNASWSEYRKYKNKN